MSRVLGRLADFAGSVAGRPALARIGQALGLVLGVGDRHVSAGRHRLVARLRDSDRTEGFDYEHEAEIELAPGQNFVVDFRAVSGGFIFM